MTAVGADGTIDCFRQFIAREDGDFGAYYAMASERYFQPTYIHAKGRSTSARSSERGGICPAAALAAEGWRRVQDVEVDSLQGALRDAGQVLSEPRR
jgi:hypothetical protein